MGICATICGGIQSGMFCVNGETACNELHWEHVLLDDLGVRSGVPIRDCTELTDIELPERDVYDFRHTKWRRSEEPSPYSRYGTVMDAEIVG